MPVCFTACVIQYFPVLISRGWNSQEDREVMNYTFSWFLHVYLLGVTMSLLYKRGWPRMIPMMHLQGQEGFGWIWYFRWASFWRQPTGGATLAQWQYDNMWYYVGP